MRDTHLLPAPRLAYRIGLGVTLLFVAWVWAELFLEMMAP